MALTSWGDWPRSAMSLSSFGCMISILDSGVIFFIREVYHTREGERNSLLGSASF